MVDLREEALKKYTETKDQYRDALLNDPNIIGSLVQRLAGWTFFEKMAFLEVATDLKDEGKLPEIHGKLVEQFAFSTAQKYVQVVAAEPSQARRGMAKGITRVFEVFAPDEAKKKEVNQLIAQISNVEPK